MGYSRIKWTEEKIRAMEADGFGVGSRASYVPWIHVRDFSSRGTSRRVFGTKTNRVHQLLSDGEYRVFLALEWARYIIDIREQYPLNREITLNIARRLGIKHPYYPGTQVPTVMTADFFCINKTADAEERVAFNVKSEQEAEDERSLEKLEIQREYFAMLQTAHHAVYSKDIPLQTVRNIEWIRDGHVKQDEFEPRPGHWASMTSRMVNRLGHASKHLTLAEFCSKFDEVNGAEPGTGLRAARILLHDRTLVVDLKTADIVNAPLEQFSLDSRIEGVPLMVAGGA